MRYDKSIDGDNGFFFFFFLMKSTRNRNFARHRRSGLLVFLNE